MRINPYGEQPVRLALDLVERPPTTAEELTDRCRQAGVAVPHPATATDLAGTLELLEEWLTVVDAPDEQVRAARLNDLLSTGSAHPRLSDHAGDGWHLHYREDDVPPAAVVRTLVVVGTAMHLSGRGMDRLGRCAAPGCDRAYADLSRTGRQRYCSSRCGNRDAVRRHRSRRHAG